MEWRRFVTYLWNDPRTLPLFGFDGSRSLLDPVQIHLHWGCSCV